MKSYKNKIAYTLVSERARNKFASKIYRFLAKSCFFIHVVYFLIFLTLGNTYVNIVNFISLIFYTIVLIRRRPNDIVKLHIEICCYIAASTFLMGWSYGFAYLLIPLVSTVFLDAFNSIYKTYLMAIIEVALFFIIRFSSLIYPKLIMVTDFKAMTEVIFTINIIIGFFIIIYITVVNENINKYLRRVLTERNTQLQELASLDPLTGLLNRRSMFEEIKSLEKEFPYFRKNFCIVIGDVDNFKNINDCYGHDCGDTVLKRVSDVILNSIRKSDFACRWGGEEFLILMSELSNNEAKRVIEDITSKLSNLNLGYDNETIEIKMTFGLSSNEENDDISKLISAADRRLYIGKQKGKDCIILEG